MPVDTVMNTDLITQIDFGRGGNSRPFEVYGLSVPEDGFTWSDGPEVGILIHGFTCPDPTVIEILGGPLKIDNNDPGRRVVVSANGIHIGDCLNTQRERLAWIVPPLPSHHRHYFIRLALPDAQSPPGHHDRRVLSLAMQSLRIFKIRNLPPPTRRSRISLPLSKTKKESAILCERICGLPVESLMLNFESIGHNCEFGFVQRMCGAEPLGLLRFSGTLAHVMVSSMDDAYATLGLVENIDPYPDELSLRDWIVYERAHSLRYHTWVKLEEATAEQIKRREVKRLAFLRRKFLEDLKEGFKIFIYHEQRKLDLAIVLPLFLAIRRHGGGFLLIVQPAGDNDDPGSVTEVLPGLLFGFISDFSDGVRGKQPIITEWINICAAAWLIRNNTSRTRQASDTGTEEALP